MKSYKLAFITDEVTQNLTEAITFAKMFGLDGVELRSVEDLPIDQIPANKLQEYKQQLDAADLPVCNLASSFFKCSITQAESEFEKLNRLCDAADILDCQTIRGFVFLAEDGNSAIPDMAQSYFHRAAEILHRRQKQLLIEADPSVTTTNHRAIANFLQELNEPAVGAIYDPGNDIYDPFQEIPYPNGYCAISPWLRHVHIKDAVKDGECIRCVRIGSGQVDYPGLLSALKRDHYCGWLSLETHYRANAVISDELMTRPGGAVFSQGGWDATAECVMALKRLLEEENP